MQIANRAAHAAELWRYDYNKHGNVAPLEAWAAIDSGDMEDRMILRRRKATQVMTLDVCGHVSERTKEESAQRMQTYISGL